MLPGLAGGQHRLLFSEKHNTQTRTHAHSHTELCWNWHPALKNVVFCLFASRHCSIEYIFWSDNGTAEQWCCQTSLTYVWRWGGLGCFGGFFSFPFLSPFFISLNLFVCTVEYKVRCPFCGGCFSWYLLLIVQGGGGLYLTIMAIALSCRFITNLSFNCAEKTYWFWKLTILLSIWQIHTCQICPRLILCPIVSTLTAVLKILFLILFR